MRVGKPPVVGIPSTPPGAVSSSTGFRRLIGLLLAISAAYGIVFIGIALGRGWPAGFGDSFALWSWGRFLADHPAATIYDPALLHPAQLALGLDPGASYPFSYPPIFLPALWLLGRLSGPVACVVLMLLTLPLLLWATAGRDWRWPVAAAVLAAPATTINIISGQTGFLEAGLLAGGLRLAGERPVLGGLLLGLAAYKPQLGLLVPIALIAAGAWRAIAAAAATGAVLFLITCLLFGPPIWLAWLEAVPRFSSQVAAESTQIRHLIPTVEAALLQLGAAPGAARLGQAAMTVLTAAAVWRLFRSGVSPMAAAGLLVGSLLATPYAFVYDLVLLTPAVIWFIAERQRAGAELHAADLLAVVIAMLSPVLMVAGGGGFPVATVSVVVLFGAVVIRSEVVRARLAAAADRGCGVAFGPPQREV